jgi:hypothetical protein
VRLQPREGEKKPELRCEITASSGDKRRLELRCESKQRGGQKCGHISEGDKRREARVRGRAEGERRKQERAEEEYNAHDGLTSPGRVEEVPLVAQTVCTQVLCRV